MKGKLTLIFTLVLFLAFTTSFALKTDPNAPDKKDVIQKVPIWKGNNLPVFDGSEMPANLKFPYPLMPADTCVPAPPTSNPDLTPMNWEQAGWTRYDMQKNSAMNRMIAVDEYSGRMNRNLAWTMLPTGIYPSETNPRYVDYNRKRTDNSWLYAWNGVSRLTEEGVNAGYVTLDVMTNGRAVASYHTTKGTPYVCARITVFSYATGSASAYWYDIPDTVIGHDRGSWPKIQIDTANYMHFAMQPNESPHVTEYIRCKMKSMTAGDSLYCQAPGKSIIAMGPDGWSPASLAYEPTVFDTNSVISATPVTSPVSGKVALVYAKWRRGNSTSGQLDNDIFYIESTNHGNDWFTAGGFGSATKVNVTQYATTDMERAYGDLSAVYDYNDNLHIIWHAHWYDEIAGLYSPRRSTLRHWTYAGGNPPGLANTQIIADAQWDGTDAGSWCLNISKMSISVKANDDAYGSRNYLYSIWSQADTGKLSAGGFTSMDLYASASSDGGLSWDGPYNVTNTPSKDCAAGNCCSEHWASLAKVVDSSLHIQYLLDRDPQGVLNNEGTWTYNPVEYLRFHAWQPVATIKIQWSPASIGFPMPKKVANGAGATFSQTMTIRNIGNQPLTINNVFMDAVGAVWTTITGLPATPFVIPLGGSQAFSLNMIPPTNDRSYIDTLFINSDDNIGNNAVKVKIHLIKSDSYFEPAYAVMGDSMLLSSSNVGNLAHEVDTAGMYLVQDTTKFLYDGTPFLASIVTYDNGSGSVTDTAVARFCFNDYYMGAASTLTTYDSITTSGSNTLHRFGTVAEFYPDVPWLRNNTCHVFWGKKIKQTTEVVTLTSAVPQLRWVYVKNEITNTTPPAYWTNPPSATFDTLHMYTGIANDFDVKSDSTDNYGGINDSLNLAYQKGYTEPAGGAYENHFAGIAYLSSTPYYSAYVTRNDTMIYPHSGYWDPQFYELVSTAGSEVKMPTAHADRNTIMTAKALASGTETTEYILAGTIKGYLDFKKTICKAFEVYGVTPPGGADVCVLCMCGDANLDAVVDIGDIVYLINYVFYGGTAPQPNDACNDVNFDTVIDIGDIVYLINYVFYGGTEPNCGF